MDPTDPLLAELIAADAQGERAISSLWAGDQFYFRGAYHTVASLQWEAPNKQRLVVRTETPQGDPYFLANIGREHQPVLTCCFDPLLLFPSILSDAHFKAENPEDNEVW